jgi:thiol-disulfide isomerase/thioredoxin
MMTIRWNRAGAPTALFLAGAALLSACDRPPDPPVATQPAGLSDPCETGPCLAPTVSATQPAPGEDKMARFAVDSPFDTDYKPPKTAGGKRIWANSCLWQDAPKLVVETWLTDAPTTKGKYVLIEFWATWCPPCRRSIHLLNRLHRAYGKDLVVIGISDQSEADVRKLKDPAIEYFSAVDTQARMKDQLGVYGIPHVIIVEPGGVVIWEGFPLLKGHELTEETVEKILAVGRKTGALKSK